MPELNGPQWEQMKRRASESLAGVVNPMDVTSKSEIAEAEFASGWNASDIERLRKMGEETDPNFARTRRARRERGGGTMAGMPVEPRGISNDYEGAGGGNFVAQMWNNPEVMATESTSALEAAVDTSHTADMGHSEDDPAAARRARGAVGAGDFAATPHVKNRFENIDVVQKNYARSLLDVAGRCKHPRCVETRRRGMELLGLDAGTIARAERNILPAVPSTAKQVKTKDGDTFIELSPADKSHPEWQAAVRQSRGKESERYDPTSILEHHHGPEDMNFEKYPLPWLG